MKKIVPMTSKLLCEKNDLKVCSAPGFVSELDDATQSIWATCNELDEKDALEDLTVTECLMDRNRDRYTILSPNHLDKYGSLIFYL